MNAAGGGTERSERRGALTAVPLGEPSGEAAAEERSIPRSKPERGEDPPNAFQLKALLTGPIDLRTISLTGLFLIASFFTLHVSRASSCRSSWRCS